MTRPRRLYTNEDGKFYYLIDGKKKFVKAPVGVSQKQIAKINIKNIVNAPAPKRIKKRRKKIEPAYGKKVGGVLEKDLTGGLPLYFFKPKRNIPTLDDQAEASADTTVDKLAKALLKGAEAKPSSSKIAATIATQTSSVSTKSTGMQTEPKPRKKETSGTEADTEKEPPKKQISVDELVKVIGEVDRRGTVNFNNVKGYLDEYYKNQYTGITSGKFDSAITKYTELAKSTPAGTPPPSMKDSSMPPPAARPPKKTGVVGMKDYSEESAYASDFVKNLMKQGGVPAPSESESESPPRQGAKGTGDGGLYNDEIE